MQTKMANGAHHEILRWRREQLIDSGFSLSAAARLADDGRYDLHALIELVERGCRPELAVRIVAPLDDKVAR
ncbi:MAG: hypothetical protein ICV59_03985 [Thermoleophilia bacterium]|nr:hypothetical protein [Thermoleophilia bacterium]